MIVRVKQLLLHFSTDSLYKNSLYLMMSNAVMAILGFFFWIICARIYTADQIGLATALISVTALITSLSILGFNNSIIRYIPGSEQKNDKINTSLTLIIIASIIFSIIFLLGIPLFAPKLGFVRDNISFAIVFILFIILSTSNVIFESIFVAYRFAKYILIKNTVLSVVKLLLPVFFLFLGSFGIFLAFGIPLAIANALCVFFLIYKFNYIFKVAINKNVLRKMMKFSFGNYIAMLIGSLPLNILPLIIINKLGTEASAYFYMDMMIANLLYVIPFSTSQSLFAEGSHNITEIKRNLFKAIKLNYLLIIPSIVITLLLGKYILLAFGQNYSSEGYQFLAIVAITGVFMTITLIGNALMYIRQKIKQLILVNIVTVILVLGLTYLFIDAGLQGIGYAWLVGQALVAFLVILIIKKII